nr:receptor-like serine/threonine-protein kinase SD1-7 isoform X1 [Ipomoea batatas]
MDMLFLSAVLLVLFQASCIGARSATLSLGQSLSPGQSLISPGGKFVLGFFHPGNSSNAYVGIWYATIPVQTVVWVLNRDNPILNSSGNATLMLSGANLLLFNDARELIWFTNVSTTISNTTQAMLLDTGNFVVKNDVFTYWQSFDYPTDTLLPGMKFGFDETSGKNITLCSWRNENQPETGLFSLQMDPNGNGEFFIRKNSSQTLWRSGPWDGEGFQFIPRRLGSNTLNFSFDGKYVLYGNDSITSRIVMTPSGIMEFLVWPESTENWNVFLSIPSYICEHLGLCGDYGICDISSSPVCKCLPGFEPKSNDDWKLADFSAGCERKSPLHCNSNEGGEDGFLKISNVKWPASYQPWEVGSTEMCRILCLQNCSCNAYAYSSNGRCLLWNEQLLDLEQLGNHSALGELFLKYPKRHKRSPVTAIAASIASVIFVCFTCLCYLWRRNLKRKGVKETTQNQNQNLLLFDLNGDVAAPNASSTLKDSNGIDKYKNYELPMFSFPSVALATDNFSIANKLGEGGFGPVYKGKLLNGQLVAIKRLSKRSGQGLKEFRTETELIAKLQHRNLAWELWTNDKVLELLDPVLQVHGSSASPDRYIAIGLLCVQERPADRPAMSEVVAMLSNDQATLASPKQPAFTAGRTVVVNAAGEVQICSANKLTISVMAPR